MPEPGKICCPEYEAALNGETLDATTDLWVSESESPPVGEADPAGPGAAPRARFLVGSQFLVGVLLSAVGALAMMLLYQAKLSDERARELDTTRRLSEEMIALMREARGAAPATAVVPDAPAVVPEGTTESKDAEVVVAAATVPTVATDLDTGPVVQASGDESRAAPPAVSAVGSPERTSAATPSAPDVVAAPASPADTKPVPEEPPVESAPASPGDRVEPRETGDARAATDPEWVWVPGLGMARGLEPRGPKNPARPVREPESKVSTTVAGPAARPEPSGPVDEARLRDLASLAFPATTRREPERPPAKVAIEWTKIEEGMSRREVEALLGEPRWVQRLLHTEFWLYADRTILGRGWVAFSDRGEVMEWSQP